MKKTAIVMVMVSVSSLIFAQQGSDGAAMAHKQNQKMKSELALSQEQEIKVAEINKKFASRQALLSADSSKTREDRQIERKRMQAERNTEIKSVLTEEQFLQWTAIKEKQRTNQGPKGKRTASYRDDMDRLKATLELTDEQYKKLIAINARMAGQMRALRRDSTISRVDFHEEIKKIKTEKNDAIRKLLTKAQYEKFVVYEKEKINHRRRGGVERDSIKRG